MKSVLSALFITLFLAIGVVADAQSQADDLPAANRCRGLLVQLGHDDPEAAPDSAWEKIWEGRRRGDDTERFVLFRRPAGTS